jgi:hypothetical protein
MKSATTNAGLSTKCLGAIRSSTPGLSDELPAATKHHGPISVEDRSELWSKVLETQSVRDVRLTSSPWVTWRTFRSSLGKPLFYAV